MISTISGEPDQKHNDFNNVLNTGRPIHGEQHVFDLIIEYGLDVWEKLTPTHVFCYNQSSDVVVELFFESHYERLAFEKLF